MKEIIKYNGETALKVNCRKIKGQYYEKNIDCFFISDKWHRIDNGLITFDYENKKYVLKNKELINGVVDFEEGELKFGYFTPNIYENINEYKSIINQGNDFLPRELINRLRSGGTLPPAEPSLGQKLSLFLIYSIKKNDINHSLLYDGFFRFLSDNNTDPRRAGSGATKKIRLSGNADIDENAYIDTLFAPLILENHDTTGENLIDFLVSFYIESTIFKESIIAYYDLEEEDDFNLRDLISELLYNSPYSTFKEIYTMSRDISMEKSAAELRVYDNFCLAHFFYKTNSGLNIRLSFESVFRIFIVSQNYNSYQYLPAAAYSTPFLGRILSNIENTSGLVISFNVHPFVDYINSGDIRPLGRYRGLTDQEAVQEQEPIPAISDDIDFLGESELQEQEPIPVKKNLIFINIKVAKKCGYNEVFGTDFVSNKAVLVNNSRYENLDYNVSETNVLQSEIEKLFKNYKVNVSEKAASLANIIGNHSFGIEYETSSGYVPKRLLYKTGLIPLKDGSLDGGYEYTSLPMKGEEGIQLVLNQSAVLDKYCNISDKCSLHVHIGNVPKTKEFGLAMYMLFKQVQEELSEMIAPYKRDVDWLIRRKKDYCKPLRSLNLFRSNIVDPMTNTIQESGLKDSFKQLFLFLTEGVPEDERFNLENGVHPRNGTGKWNWKSRYYSLNMINLYFSKSGTVEFRMHTPSVNKYKVLNWLFICSSICRYAENNIVKILSAKDKIDLYEIFTVQSEIAEEDFNVVEYLREYVISRKKEFDQYYFNNNYADSAPDEISNDKRYSFIRDYFPNYEYEQSE